MNMKSLHVITYLIMDYKTKHVSPTRLISVYSKIIYILFYGNNLYLFLFIHINDLRFVIILNMWSFQFVFTDIYTGYFIEIAELLNKSSTNN
jgi:hypothetical protein